MTDNEKLDGEAQQVEGGQNDGEEFMIESLDEIPDHVNDRVVPGHSRAAQEFVEEKFREVHEETFDPLYGLIAVGIGTAHMYGEDWGVVVEDVSLYPSGDLTPYAIKKPREIEEPDPDLLIENWYSKKDKEYPCYEVTVVGAERFYRWAPDEAHLHEVASGIIAAGDFGGAGVVTQWRADIDEVDVNQLAIQKTELQRRLEEVSTDAR